MQIEMTALELIHPYENNPRDNDGAVDAVAESIKEFGFKVPIVVDKAMTIVAGHTRYKAAQKLGIAEVPVIKAEELSSEQIQAYRIIDNKTAEMSKWDYGKLDEELSMIMDIDMTRFGFGDGFDDGEGLRTQDLDDSEEISLDEFEDENFNCECPMCGFKWNE